jgi:hypothetical protein
MPATSFLVASGSNLNSLNIDGSPVVFTAANYEIGNITPAQDFEFVGWSPVVDATAPVYADRVYQAQFSYEPEGASGITYTPLEVHETEPGAYEIQATGYVGYYDGAPHGIHYTLGSNLDLVRDNIQMYWKLMPPASPSPSSNSVGTTGFLAEAIPTGGGGLSPDQIRVYAGEPVSFSASDYLIGLPPDETNVIDEEADIVFLADGMNPGEIDLHITIKPRPLVPTATHAEMTVDDGIPLRETYGLTMGYDDKKADGTLIGDGFSFAGHEGEFALDGVPLTTTYIQGDPEGSYPIYAKAGVYGNYEIYEGTEGDWPNFPGWRFAGVVEVKAPSSEKPIDEGGDTTDKSPVVDSPRGTMPSTGDTVGPPLLLALCATLLAGLALVAFSLYRNRTSRAGQRPRPRLPRARD